MSERPLRAAELLWWNPSVVQDRSSLRLLESELAYLRRGDYLARSIGREAFQNHRRVAPAVLA
jgi:hypothetical protein